MEVQGTNIPSLRTWCLEHPGPNQFLYVSYQDVKPEQRLSLSNVAYMKEVCRITEITDVWGKNCQGDLPKEGDKVETGPLQELAKQFGLPSHPLQGPGAKDTGGDAHELDENEDKGKVKQKKRKKGPRLVKEMLEKAAWKTQGTPLDPHYRKPIRIKLKGLAIRRQAVRVVHQEQSPAPEGGQEASRLPHQEVLQGGSCGSSSVHSGGKPGLLCRFQEVLQADPCQQNLIPSNSEGNVDVELRAGQHPERKHFGSTGHHVSEVESAGTPDRGISSRLGQSGGGLPKELTGLSSAAESRVAQREYHAELKLAKAMKGKGKASPVETPHKGDPPKGKQKGLKGGKSEPKGGKASESQVVKV